MCTPNLPFWGILCILCILIHTVGVVPPYNDEETCSHVRRQREQQFCDLRRALFVSVATPFSQSPSLSLESKVRLFTGYFHYSCFLDPLSYSSFVSTVLPLSFSCPTGGGPVTCTNCHEPTKFKAYFRAMATAVSLFIQPHSLFLSFFLSLFPSLTFSLFLSPLPLHSEPRYLTREERQTKFRTASLHVPTPEQLSTYLIQSGHGQNDSHQLCASRSSVPGIVSS